MKQTPKRNIKKDITNAFGSLGYFFSILLWFWAVMLYFSLIQSATLFVAPDANEQVEQQSSYVLSPPGPLEVVLLVVIVIVMIAVTIYALVKIPRSIAKAGNKVVHRTTEAVVPVIIRSQRQKDTKKVRGRITTKVIVALKLLLILIPVGLTVGSGLLEKPSIDYTIAMIIGCGLAGIGVFFFAAQYVLAGLLRIKVSELW